MSDCHSLPKHNLCHLFANPLFANAMTLCFCLLLWLHLCICCFLCLCFCLCLCHLVAILSGHLPRHRLALLSWHLTFQLLQIVLFNSLSCRNQNLLQNHVRAGNHYSHLNCDLFRNLLTALLRHLGARLSSTSTITTTTATTSIARQATATS